VFTRARHWLLPWARYTQSTSPKPISLTFILMRVSSSHVCETWSLALREEHRLRVFENRVLRKYLDLKGRKMDRGENCIMMNFMTCNLHQILLGWLNQGRWGGRDMWHAWGGERCSHGFGWEARTQETTGKT
jgi:hypothetical protein